MPDFTGMEPMPNRPLSGIKACVFDAYGTLFDFASAARACPDVPGEAAPVAQDGGRRIDRQTAYPARYGIADPLTGWLAPGQ